MKTFFIKDVEFNLKENYIQVGKNYGNQIEFKNIETARKIYKAIRDNKIEVKTGTLDSFKTINEIKELIAKEEK